MSRRRTDETPDLATRAPTGPHGPDGAEPTPAEEAFARKAAAEAAVRRMPSVARSREKPTEVPGDHEITEFDLHLFNEGNHVRLYEKLGAHRVTRGKQEPVIQFAVWAPNARTVSVIGDFNGWDPRSHQMAAVGSSGIWRTEVPDLGNGTVYKYRIVSRGGYQVDKADPFALHAETPPNTGSKVWQMDHAWGDAEWMASRAQRQALDAPMSIYELHVGSWRKYEDGGGAGHGLSYRDLAEPLIEHVQRMSFTHVELLPIMEHPFGGSWGYQTTGFFAPTSRFGTPEDFAHLVDRLHQAGIGVILDWVPSHFPNDEHGLSYFDGTHLFEHEDPRQGFHPDWNSLIFNYGRNEVRSFLISSALSWLDRFHVDGIRVDAVASMLYLDYSRQDGEWIPNEWGGNENIEAIEFLRQLNSQIYANYPDAQTMAEESTAWPMVSRPTYIGGLGFGFKWDMGWMHDTLEVFQRDPVYRKHHHNQLTFRAVYQFTENYVMPLSHDEVVHGKGSMIDKMPGDDWQKFANLRTLYGYQFTLPGKKLLFMGDEFGQRSEWNHDVSLDWAALEGEQHAQLLRCVGDIAGLYRDLPALHARDCHPEGFEWVDASDWEHNVLSWIRRGEKAEDVALVLANFTPIPRHNYRVGVPVSGFWRERFNSDAGIYGGSGQGNLGGVEATPLPHHGRSHSINVTLPPLSLLVLVPVPIECARYSHISR
ncbi:MAG TPA: 1,4-alpha-glucan branching protein GlgB [Nitriliruptorales bacterium]